MSITRKVIVVFALLAMTIAASGCTTKVITAPQGGASANTVTASGFGKASATPDEAIMSFGVTKRAKDADKALAAASAAADKINKELKRLGVGSDDIQTSGVNVYATYQSSGDKTAISGFEASINVTAKVKDLSKLGAIITALANVGADNVSGPSFGISEDTVYRGKAIEKAVADARTQANDMAKAADKSVGEVISITSSSVNVPGPMYGYGDAAIGAKSANVPIEPGQLDVTASVTVVFELK